MTDENNNIDVPKYLSDLKETIYNIDGLSQEGLDQIKAIASLAMSRLDSGFQHYWEIEHVFQALQTIASKADEIETCISSEARSVKCDFSDNRFLVRQRVLAEAVKNG